MNRSHELLSREARLEQQLIEAARAPTDPELAADWRLRNELKALGPAALSTALRERLHDAIHPRRSRFSGRLGLAMAAGLAAVLVVVGPMHQSEPEIEPNISARDIADFQLAMNILETTSRRAVTITGRELIAHVRLLDIEFDTRSYIDLFDSMTLPSLYRRVTSGATNESQTDAIHSFPTGELK